MAEQESREKIADIIYHTGYTGACCECDYSKVSDADTYCKALLKADALIAAGIGDVKESKLESDHFWRMWQGALVELERAEHRAEVLGRALAIMRGKGLISCVVDDYISQAEKELAEEKKE